MKSTRNTWLLRTVAAAAVVLPVLGGSIAQAADPELVMKVGITPSPGSVPGLEVQHFADLIKERTNGAVEVKLFASSLLGKENTQLEGMIAGTHDGFAHVSAYTGRVKEERYWDLPFLFPDLDAVKRVTQGPLRKDIEEHYRKYDLELLALWGYGYRQFMGNKRPYYVPTDLQGIKHRIPGGKSKQILFTALGANPSTVTFSELYQALKAGVVDSQDNPLSINYETKFHEVTKYLSICNYIYNPQILAVGKPFWAKVPDKYKKILKEVGLESEAWSYDLIVKLDNENLEKMKQEAPQMKINYCKKEDLPKWQAASKPVYDAFIEDTSKVWFDKVMKAASGS
jgi:tripartite ATP-independent transporter DctP family solute receptor